MHFDIDRLSPEARRQVLALMEANGLTLGESLNQILEEAVSDGATSAVGRRKAKVLQLVVTPKRASCRDSSG